MLLKLHGSCNFRNIRDYPNGLRIEITGDIFPRISSYINSRESDSDFGPHVLIMSYLKTFPNEINQLWRKAINVLSEAEKLVIIGCSLRDEDTFLRFALNHFGMKEGIREYHIDIVDKDSASSNNIKSKVEKLVAWPDDQNIQPFVNGLAGYLENE